jgi:peroxiredoxin
MKTFPTANPLRRAIFWGLMPVLALASFSCDGAGGSASVGNMAPDFQFTPIDGEPQRLSDFKGKPVIVNFFATWCPPCMMELPELDRKIARPFADRGLVVIIIGLDQVPDDVAAFKKKTDYSFVIATDPRSEIFSKFTTQESIPQTFLIKPDGTIAMHLTGYEPSELQQLKVQVDKLLSPVKAP